MFGSSSKCCLIQLRKKLTSVNATACLASHFLLASVIDTLEIPRK